MCGSDEPEATAFQSQQEQQQHQHREGRLQQQQEVRRLQSILPLHFVFKDPPLPPDENNSKRPKTVKHGGLRIDTAAASDNAATTTSTPAATPVATATRAAADISVVPERSTSTAAETVAAFTTKGAAATASENAPAASEDASASSEASETSATGGQNHEDYPVATLSAREEEAVLALLQQQSVSKTELHLELTAKSAALEMQARSNLLLLLSCMLLVGLLNAGPDAILGAAAAQDLLELSDVPLRNCAAIAAFINAVGAVGALLQVLAHKP